MNTNRVKPTIILFAYLVLTADEAHAYLDPGSAGLIIQGLVASILGGLVVIKVYWARLKAFVLGRSNRTEKTSEPDDQIGELTEGE